ncbi:glutamate-5-semialdehyde dehydrogenase [Sphingosinicella sp. LY1275]|uniref:glutamate-5-semialdehyde dehydrogenase n=1 Tax=Sphingosinicella sp. LY1275 TaxID=3095379 RepID=UPI002ADEE98C|nr:glutamate-5-semialdehyde dehydrogenase [Sphingosinicella sp. LY1275]MEA1016026.1 glutamate-5-semialdehyde dehydrogenase [Sphingosinicella sp. LY1275]
MEAMGREARDAAAQLRTGAADTRGAAIVAMARRLRENKAHVLAANAADVAQASGMVDRLRLDEARVEAIARSLEEVASLPDPVGEEIARWTRPNGLDIARVRTPIGVIGMIYESRPNVTADAAAICLRSGNAVILRSGSEALRSAVAIHEALASGLEDVGLPRACVQMVDTADREAVGLMLEGLGGAIDLIIPRGGKALVERVSAEARVATLGHLEGICHTYVHRSADPDKAVAIVRNAKMRRVSICGATETLLIDRAAAADLLPAIAAALDGCELRGDAESRCYVPMLAADEADWSTEYLAPVLSVRTVDGPDAAIAHIARYGTGHTEAIVCEDEKVAEDFLARVDSAIVIWNASTQFADGGEFGFGAEIGIATGKLHARGPVGPEQLTSFKYQVRGRGQLRPD